MAQFFDKYKNLFLSPPRPSVSKSYLNTRLFNSEIKRAKPLAWQSDNHYDIFKEEILPKLKRLNKQQQVLQKRIKTQEYVPQPSTNFPMNNPQDINLEYKIKNPKMHKKSYENNFTHEDGNIFKKFKEFPQKQKRNDRIIKNQKVKTEQDYERKKTRNIFRKKHLNFKPIDERRKKMAQFTEQEQDYQQEPSTKHFQTLPHQRIKLQENLYPNNSTLERQPHILAIQPQNLVFSEYEKTNQYVILNERLDDIKRACRYRPHGYINSYRQAILKRVQSKKNMQERRRSLKKLFEKEREEYIGKLPLI